MLSGDSEDSSKYAQDVEIPDYNYSASSLKR